MKKSLAPSSFGISRSSHAAAIAMSAQSWGNYGTLHDSIFAENGLNKYVLLDEKGAIIATNSKASNLVINASHTLRHEDFLTIQDMITEIRRRKLNGITDLQEAGLSFSVDIGDQIVGTEMINSFEDALQEQNPTGYTANDTVFSITYAPNPVTHMSFGIPWRQKGFEYKSSMGLKECMRKVAERLENTLFNGNDEISVNFAGTLQVIYGYTNFPDRGLATISDWANVSNSDLIVNEVISMSGDMFADQGGVELDSLILYYPKNYKEAMDRDYSSLKGDLTVAERIMRIPEIKAVKFAEYLEDSNVVLVEMLERTVQLAVASDIVSVPHVKTHPMEDQVMTTYAAMVQILKSDSNGNCGILHATVA